MSNLNHETVADIYETPNDFLPLRASRTEPLFRESEVKE